MIHSYRHKGLEAFATKQEIHGIRPGHAKRLTALLRELNTVKHVGEISRSARLHRLYYYPERPANSVWSVWVSAQWRLLFQWNSRTRCVENIDYVNYH